MPLLRGLKLLCHLGLYKSEFERRRELSSSSSQGKLRSQGKQLRLQMKPCPLVPTLEDMGVFKLASSRKLRAAVVKLL